MDTTWTRLSGRICPIKFILLNLPSILKMTDFLIKKAFEKARKESGKDSVNGQAEYLAEYLLDKFKYQLSAKSLTRYYKKESVPNKKVQDFLSAYLGFGSYEEFVIDHGDKVEEPVLYLKPKTFKPFFSKKLALISLLFVSVTGVSSYIGFKAAEEKCMAWNEDHYVEVKCTGVEGETKLNPVVLQEFRKIEVSDTTTFFKNGSPSVWYDKSNNQLEYFSSPGIHPENGKTLRPITKYMIDKYVRRSPPEK